MTPKRIMIFGRPGSGKSTFAMQLSKHLNIPVYHLDCYFFDKNWQERPADEFAKIHIDLIMQDTWIIDGNAIKYLETRYARADLVLYFCYPRWVCLWRIFKRLFQKNRVADRAEGCKEQITWKLIQYLWTFNTRVKASIEQLTATYPNIPLICISNNQELK